MQWVTIVAAVSASVFVLAAPAPAFAKKACVLAGGSANMITRDLAEFMAKAALKNSIEGMGAKPIGGVKLSCQAGLPVYCLAKQKACK